MYTMVSRYLQYQTVTHVKPIIWKSDMSPIIESMCTWMKNGSILNRNLTLNGHEVHLGNIYSISGYKCRDIAHFSGPLLENQIFESDETINIENKIGIIKRIRNDSVADFMSVMSPRKECNRNSVYEIRLLLAPYDTDCLFYNTSQKQCSFKCSRSANQSIESKSACSNQCIKPGCLTLKLIEEKRSLWPSNGLIAATFSKDVLIMNSGSSLTMISFVQQVLGLVTLFFDIAIVDIIVPLIVIAKYIMKLIRSKCVQRLLKNAEKHLNRLLKSIILCGLLFHQYAYIVNYMKYNTSSETLIGLNSDMTVPYLRICSNGKSMNTTVEVEILGSSRLIYLTDNQSCYDIIPDYLNKTFKVYMIALRVVGNQSIRASFSYKLPCPNHEYIMSELGASWIFDSHLYFERLLPHPYWTSCIDYKDEGFNSSTHCYESCTMSNHERNVSIENKCSDICSQKDCSLKKLILVDRRQVGAKHGIGIMPWNELKSINLSPEQSWIDFITVTASLLGLWLGLSAMDIPGFIHRFKLVYQFPIHFIAVSLLYCICSFQMYFVIHNYLRYEIVSKVHLGTPDHYNLPLVSFLRTIETYRVSNSSTMPPTALAQLRSDYNIRVTRISIRNPESGRLEAVSDGGLEFQASIYWYNLMCLKFSEIYPNQYKYADSRNILISLNIYFPKRSSNLVYIFLTNFITDIRYLDVTTLEYRVYRIIPRMYKTKLLPVPYSSKCINHGIYIQSECYKNMHFSKYGKYPQDIVIPSSSNVTRMAGDHDIKMKCYNKYKDVRYCDTTKYITRIRGKNKKSATIDIEVPDMKTSCTFFPKTFFYDLIILIGDVFGLWLGISFGSFMKYFYKMHKACKSPNKNDFLVDTSTVVNYRRGCECVNK